MKVGDRVVMVPMWKHRWARGKIIKMTRDGYTVVRWDDINGDWHYTEEQSKRLHLEDKTMDEEALWRMWGDQ